MFAKGAMHSADQACCEFFISPSDGGKVNMVVKQEWRRNDPS